MAILEIGICVMRHRAWKTLPRADHVSVLFGRINSINDAAHSITTIGSTVMLKPRDGALWPSFLSFGACFTGSWLGFEAKSASAGGKGLVDLNLGTKVVALCVLMGTFTWRLMTWWLGNPTCPVRRGIEGRIVQAGIVTSLPVGVVMSGLLFSAGRGFV